MILANKQSLDKFSPGAKSAFLPFLSSDTVFDTFYFAKSRLAGKKKGRRAKNLLIRLFTLFTVFISYFLRTARSRQNRKSE